MSPARLLRLLTAALAATALTAVAAPSAGASTVEVIPRVSEPGTTLAIAGAGFLPDLRVRLYIGPPHSGGAPVGSTLAGADGRFVRQVRTRTSTEPGRYFVVACQRQCRIKATFPFR